MIDLFVVGIAVRADGLDGWQAARPVLAGEAPYIKVPAQIPAAVILAPNERRRAGPLTRLALAVAWEASNASGLPPASLRSVFASSNGDGATVHAILETLTGPDPHISPTHFHNSVHNAAAGYWSIGVGSAQPATCIGCHDYTFAAALIAAASEATVEQQPVLLCIYDIPLPEPLNGARPSAGIFGAGLVFSPTPLPLASTRVQISWRPNTTPPERAAPQQQLAGLALANPAARSLRLLEALARQQVDRLAVALLEGHVEVIVQPC
jgi:hypothetical protein